MARSCSTPTATTSKRSVTGPEPKSALPRKTKKLVDAMSVGLVVGGTIVVPHLRRAMEFLDDLDEA